MDFKTNKYISKVLFYFSEMVNKSCGLIMKRPTSFNDKGAADSHIFSDSYFS